MATTTTTTDESFFLGTLKSDDSHQTSWTTNLLLKGQMVNVKLDTGAEVTVINRQTLQQLPRIQLQPTSKTLLGPAQHPLKVTGQFGTTLTKDDRTTTQTIFVVPEIKTNLLGLPAIIALQLLSRINSTTKDCTADHIQQEFPSLFQGLGNLGEEYCVEMREGMRPYAIFTPRNVPIPL